MSNKETIENYLKTLKKYDGSSADCKSFFRLQARYIELVTLGLTVMFDKDIAEQIISVFVRKVPIKLSSRFTEDEKEQLLVAIVEHTLSNVKSMYDAGMTIEAIAYSFKDSYELVDN